ncbi:MAG: hypothetical protein IJQ07_07195 [Clostridia bacterium]|nr:hypothetical protein [Clostridia bacterium]
MYCKYCGKEINDDAEICVHCGRSTGVKDVQYRTSSGESKTGIGVLLGLFLGLIGLIIGLLLYPSNTEERSSFLKGWLGAFIVTIVVGIVIYVAAVGCVATTYRYY